MAHLPKSAWLARTAAALWLVKSIHRVTNQDMADAMGCSDQTVANAMRGDSELGAYYLHRAQLTWPDIFDGVDALGRVA